MQEFGRVSKDAYTYIPRTRTNTIGNSNVKGKLASSDAYFPHKANKHRTFEREKNVRPYTQLPKMLIFLAPDKKKTLEIQTSKECYKLPQICFPHKAKNFGNSNVKRTL